MSRRPRGYLMIEVAIGGALLAITLGYALTFLATGRSEVSGAAHQSSAVHLARAKLDEIATNATCTGAFVATSVGTEFPGFEWQATVTTSTIGTNSTPALTNTFCEAIVTVTFPVGRGTRVDVADATNDGRGTLSARRMWSPI